MEQPTVRKTFKYKLMPTPIQERELGRVLGLCRWLYNTALEQRISAWQRVRVPLSRDQQEADLTDLRSEMPEDAAIHSHVRHEGLARLEKTDHAYFRRLLAGAKAGVPRSQGRDRSHCVTDNEVGNGATLDNGCFVLATIGRMAVRWSRPGAGTPKTVTLSRQADGWSVCCSCADGPVRSLPATGQETGQETGIDLGIEAFAPLSEGTRSFSPAWYRQAERALNTAPRRVSRRKKGSSRRRQAVNLLAQAHQPVRRQRGDCHHQTALQLVRALVRANDVLYHEDVPTATMVRNHPLAKRLSDAGWAAFVSILTYQAACTRQQAPVGESSPCRLPTRARRALAAACWSRRAYPSAGMPARTAERASIATTTRQGPENGSGSAFGQRLRGGTGLPVSQNRASVGL